ncbi:DUF1365 domain-containing protein [Francisella frigiditurris]|uniref:DUF1365 domain-containing protein n=1 Tax=Francisella frigiditurris TaxID=1542390 RepID=A0A1J0KST9_9GAMM|nr:DUF1365 domain-containing protein [Francisella frigiditurris]APC96762.1 hypothetical protein KX01_1186 [Francisella frigiditurris]
MGLGKSYILDAIVSHKRTIPKTNYFKYRTYYTALNMSNLEKCKKAFFSIDRFNILSFYNKDHGYRNTQESTIWAKEIFDKNKIQYTDITLITMPRVLGYLFNPVSFWLALDNNHIIGVIAEVNNTFKETHSYVCYDIDSHITKENWFKANKEFHVSPFFERQGYYKFNFDINLQTNSKVRIIINYFNNKDQLELATSIDGKLKEFTNINLIKQFFKVPLLTLKVITLIHYQALKLFIKGLKYIPKPQQKESTISIAKNINKI